MSSTEPKLEVLKIDHVFSGNTATRVKLLNFKNSDLALRASKQTLIDNEKLIAEQLANHGVKTSVIARVEKTQLAIVGQNESGKFLALIADGSEFKQLIVGLTANAIRQVEYSIERDAQDEKATA